MPNEHAISLSISALAFVLLTAAPAGAQGEFIEANPAQTQLNNEGVEAVNGGDYQKAILIFEASIELGPLNITYLNLGRSYAKAGLCDKAIEAYDNTLTSPKVPDPPPEIVRETVERFRADLKDQCPGKVQVTCEPESLKISIDNEDPIDCPNEPLLLKPGAHRISATLFEQRVDEDITVVSLQVLKVTLTIKKTDEITEKIIKKPVKGTEPRDGVSLSAIGWTVAGVGAAAVGTALVLDVFSISPDIEELERLQTLPGESAAFDELKGSIESAQSLNLVLFVGGGAAIAAGVTLWLLDDPVSEAPPRPGARLSPWVAPDNAGVLWIGSW